MRSTDCSGLIGSFSRTAATPAQSLTTQGNRPPVDKGMILEDAVVNLLANIFHFDFSFGLCDCCLCLENIGTSKTFAYILHE